MRTPEDMDRDPDDPEPAGQGDIKMQYSSDYLCHPSTVEVT
jgi:hypothetical protein